MVAPICLGDIQMIRHLDKIELSISVLEPGYVVVSSEFATVTLKEGDGNPMWLFITPVFPRNTREIIYWLAEPIESHPQLPFTEV